MSECARCTQTAHLLRQKADLLARHPGGTTIDMAWWLRRVVDDPWQPDAQVSHAERGVAQIERHLREVAGDE